MPGIALLLVGSAFDAMPHRFSDHRVLTLAITSTFALAILLGVVLANRWAAAGARAVAFLLGRDTASSDWFGSVVARFRRDPVPAIAVYVHMLRDGSGAVDTRGKSPFAPYPDLTIPTFDWAADDGPRNISTWIFAALAKG